MSTQGEGTRGGKIIGHYRSGRAKYASAEPQAPSEGMTPAQVRATAVTAASGFAFSKLATPATRATRFFAAKQSRAFSKFKKWEGKGLRMSEGGKHWASKKGSLFARGVAMEMRGAKWGAKAVLFHKNADRFAHLANASSLLAIKGHYGKVTGALAASALVTDAGYKVYQHFHKKIQGSKKA